MSWADRRTLAPVAVVTGAVGGLGNAIAAAFLSHGYRVALTDLRADAVEVAAKGFDPTGERAIGVQHDIRSRESFEQVLATTIERLGEPSVLVNNAGATLFGDPFEITAEEFNAGLELNLCGAFLGTQVFGRYFAQHGYGRIVNIASLAGQNGGTASGVHYASAKAGAIGLTKVFARALAERGVTVNAVAPGPLDVPSVREGLPAERLAAIEASIPVGRLLSPTFVAETVVLLASEDAASVTGATWDINGGLNVR